MTTKLINDFINSYSLSPPIKKKNLITTSITNRENCMLHDKKYHGRIFTYPKLNTRSVPIHQKKKNLSLLVVLPTERNTCYTIRILRSPIYIPKTEHTKRQSSSFVKHLYQIAAFINGHMRQPPRTPTTRPTWNAASSLIIFTIDIVLLSNDAPVAQSYRFIALVEHLMLRH